MPVTEPFTVGDYMPLAHAEIDAALAAGRRPIVVGGTGLYLRAALADLSLVKAPPEAEDSELWSPRDPPPDADLRPRHGPGAALRADRRPGRGDRRRGRRARRRAAPTRSAPSRTARKALGFDELLAGDVETMKKRSRNYARRQLTWMRKIPNLERSTAPAASDAEVGRRDRRRDDRLRAVKFEKWQALGNDYLILEAGRTSPGSSTRSGSSGSATRISGSAPTASCCSRAARTRSSSPSLRIFNPDGSEAELSGNGAREAILYLRRHGWTDEDDFAIRPSPGRSCRRSPAS